MTLPMGPDGQMPRLRNVRAQIITADDAALLVTALNAFFDDAGEQAVLLQFLHIADWEVLIIYAE